MPSWFTRTFIASTGQGDLVSYLSLFFTYRKWNVALKNTVSCTNIIELKQNRQIYIQIKIQVGKACGETGRRFIIDGRESNINTSILLTILSEYFQFCLCNTDLLLSVAPLDGMRFSGLARAFKMSPSRHTETFICHSRSRHYVLETSICSVEH